MLEVTWDRISDLVKEDRIYATRDVRDGVIDEYAYIEVFGGEDALEKAHEFLLEGYDADEFDLDGAVYTHGEFADFWHNFSKAPTDADLEHFCGPFGVDGVRIERPGHHPGGREWWITPLADVLTVAIRPKAEPAWKRFAHGEGPVAGPSHDWQFTDSWDHAR